MGLFDQVKKAATTVGSEAGKAGRQAQAQVKLKSLQGDVGDAEKELGQAAFDLIDGGQLQAPALEAQMAKVREAKAAVAAKEAEIAAIKAEGEEGEAGAAPTSTPPAGGAGGTNMPGT